MQVIHDIPQPPPEALLRLLFDELQVIVDAVPTGPFRVEDWQNILPDGIRPFFQTARDVRRYLNSVPVTLRVIGAEVALVDVLALEAIRVFAPRAYAELPASVATLSGAHNIGGAAQAEIDQVDAERIAAIMEAAGEHAEPTKATLRRLFPCIGHHLGGSRMSGYEQQARRLLSVADHNILRTYLERTLPEGVISGVLVGEAASILGDRDQLASLFETLDAETAEGLIQRLEDYEHEFDPDVVEPALPVLINQSSRLREGRRGMFDIDSDMVVGRLVLRLLRRVDNELRLGIVEQVLPEITSLTGRMKLADIVGHRENLGHGLIEESDAVRLYAAIEQQVMDASPEQLADEHGLFKLFLRIAQDKGDDGITWIRAACAHDNVLLRLLRSELGAQQSQTLGEYAVRRRPSLPWELFETWLGAAYLRELIDRLAELDSAGWNARTIEALQTAQAYASGAFSNNADI